MTENTHLKDEIMGLKQDVNKIEASINRKLATALIVFAAFLFFMAVMFFFVCAMRCHMQSKSEIVKAIGGLGDLVNEGVNKLCGPVEREAEAKLEIFFYDKKDKQDQDKYKADRLRETDHVPASIEEEHHELVICDIILKNSGYARISYPFIKLYLKPGSPELRLCGEGTADKDEGEEGYQYEGYTIPERALITAIPVGVSIHCPLKFPIPDHKIIPPKGSKSCEYKARLRLFYGDKVRPCDSYDFTLELHQECEPKGCSRRH